MMVHIKNQITNVFSTTRISSTFFSVQQSPTGLIVHHDNDNKLLQHTAMLRTILLSHTSVVHRTAFVHCKFCRILAPCPLSAS